MHPMGIISGLLGGILIGGAIKPIGRKAVIERGERRPSNYPMGEMNN